jgi:hypothetical protein
VRRFWSRAAVNQYADSARLLVLGQSANVHTRAGGYVCCFGAPKGVGELSAKKIAVSCAIVSIFRKAIAGRFCENDLHAKITGWEKLLLCIIFVVLLFTAFIVAIN